MPPPVRSTAKPMGFFPVQPSTAKRRMIVSLYGPQKSGKNHLAFTAPGPFGFHSFDYGDEGMIEKFVAGTVTGCPPIKVDKAEYVVDIQEGATPQEVTDKTTPAWQSFMANYRIGLVKYRTSIIDTGTDAYEMVRMSHFGKLTQVMPHHYAPVNAEFKSLFRQAYSAEGKNLIILARHKEEWLNSIVQGKEKGVKTGRMIYAGYKDTPYEVQIHIRTFKDSDGFGAEILDCRQNPDIEGFELRGEMLNWWSLGQLVFPESTEEEWR